MRAGMATDQWKRSVDDYVNAAGELARSMKVHGFKEDWPVMLDPDNELLSGAHRVACALALGLERIVVNYSRYVVWAPPWGRPWFVIHGMSDADLERLDLDWERM